VSIQETAPKGDLAARWPRWGDGAVRRALALRKLLMFKEKHLDLVKDRIRARFQNPELSADISLFATKNPNLVKAVVEAVTIPYSRGCTRELKGAKQPVAKAFAEVVAESGIVKKGNGIAARAWFLGPTLVSPHLDTRNKLAFDVITPDRIELKTDGEYVEAALWLEKGTAWIEVDREAWRVWSLAGQLQQVVYHAVGVCPAVPFVGIDNTGDFWLSDEHSGLCDASLDCSYKMAFGLYNRQVSANMLTVIQGELKGIPPGQSLGHSALPIFTRAHPGEVDVKVLNRIIPAAEHLSEIAAIIALAVSVYGLPPNELSGAVTQDWGAMTVTVRGERLGVLRDRQVPWLKASELELWPLVCDLIRGGQHRHASVLPPGDEVREMLRVTFPELAPPADVILRLQALEAGLPHGISSATEFLRQATPEETTEDIEERIAERLKSYADRNEALASRNAPVDASHAGNTLAQIQGREGGQTRAAKAQETTP